MDHLLIAATFFLILFVGVASLDGLYFHLWKYRLYTRPESLYEHKLHTIRAFLFIPTIYFLFYKNFAGIALLVGVAFILGDLVVEMLDVFDEKQSRANIGGLSSTEYAAHVTATTFRIAAIALALAAKPLPAWSLSAPLFIETEQPIVSFVAFNVITGNFFVGALHVWLMRDKYRSFGDMLPVRSCCGL